jgi:flagellar hook-associated protein 3 FlgL
MRIIFDVLRDGLSAINTAADQMALAQQQLSSGRRVSAASDDPLAVQQAVGEHASIGALDAYTRAADSIAPRLSAADNVISDIVEKLSAVLVAATSARGSAVSPATRDAAAKEVMGLREALVGNLNTTFNGTYLFSGSRVDQAAYAQVGGVWTYQGDAAAVRVEVDRGRQIAVSFDGQAIAQGGDATDVFTELDALITAIENGDNDAIGAGMAAVQRAFDRAQVALGRLGVDERSLDDAYARLSGLRRAAETRRSKLEDANMAEAATRLQQADTSYRAALAAVSTAERLTLLDYLR